MFEEIINHYSDDPEYAKLVYLYVHGLIDGRAAEELARIVGKDLKVHFRVSVEGREILAPAIIVAKPSKFYLYPGEPADIYTKSFPAVSLLSLERAIIAVADFRIPWRLFTLYISNSYADSKSLGVTVCVYHRFFAVAARLLSDVGVRMNLDASFIELGYEPPVNLDRCPSFEKQLNHLKKVLGLYRDCDDSEWYRLGLWGDKEPQQVPTKLARDLAVLYGIPVSAAKYILSALANNNEHLVAKYAAIYRIPEEKLKAIIEHYRTLVNMNKRLI